MAHLFQQFLPLPTLPAGLSSKQKFSVSRQNAIRSHLFY